jgi:maltokinase
VNELSSYVFASRWFGGKGRSGELAGTERLGTVGTSEPHVVIEIATVTYADAPGAPEFYQLPLALYAQPQPGAESWFIGQWDVPGFGPSFVYDAVHDPAAARKLLHEFREPSASGVRFHRVGDNSWEDAGAPTLFAGEQSNSSIAFGDTVLLKLFRRISPGANPDIALHRELTRAACDNVAELRGWIECDSARHPQLAGTLHLGMLQEFLSDAEDGWALAVESAGPNAPADFEPLARELGVAIARVHRDLCASLGITMLDAHTIAAGMHDRLAKAAQSVPALAPYVVGLTATYAAAGRLGPVACHRVHGDLHLGQTLYSSSGNTRSGWKVVDFEGEPAKSLGERTRPDSPWRDIAGMLRSFDYAQRTAEHAPDLWAQRAEGAFLDGYLGRALSSAEQTLLTAYLADKAVYEVVYETRNRPSWVSLPLAALSRWGAA